MPETADAYAERVGSGNYIDFTIDRTEAARYGLSVGDIEGVIRTAIGGMTVGQIVDGIERFPISIRYAREMRDNPEQLQRVLVPDSDRCHDTSWRGDHDEYSSGSDVCAYRRRGPDALRVR